MVNPPPLGAVAPLENEDASEHADDLPLAQDPQRLIADEDDASEAGATADVENEPFHSLAATMPATTSPSSPQRDDQELRRPWRSLTDPTSSRRRLGLTSRSGWPSEGISYQQSCPQPGAVDAAHPSSSSTLPLPMGSPASVDSARSLRLASQGSSAPWSVPSDTEIAWRLGHDAQAPATLCGPDRSCDLDCVLTPRCEDAWRSTSEPGILVSSRSWATIRRSSWERPLLPAAVAQTFAATLSSVPIKAPTQTFLCRICLENVPVASRTVMAECGVEAHSTCLDCLKTYLELRISEGRVEELCCPCAYVPSTSSEAAPEDEEVGSSSNRGCGAFVTEAELRRWFSSDLIEKHQRFSQMQADPRLRACPKCQRLCSPEVREDGGIVAELRCKDCSMTFCYYHSSAHEPGPEACAEYERKCVREQLLDAGLFGAKPCPRCGALTQKAQGCNHMTCKCKANWCWVCGRQLDNVGWHYNPANPNGCMQFQDQLTTWREGKLMVVCKLLSIPAMLASVALLIFFLLCLAVFSFIPMCFCFKELGFKVWMVLAATIAGTPFALFSIVWGLIGIIFWVLLIPCGVGEVHLQFLLGVPIMTTLAICEGVIGPPGRAAVHPASDSSVVSKS